MLDLVIDAVLDTVKIWPLLFLVYLVFEFIGNKRSDYLKGKTMGPIIGALSGCIPQCGASVAAAGLYARRAITIGTLFAVFISTSDEAIPLLMMYPEKWGTVGFLLLIKVAFAIVVGVSIDFAFKSYNKKKVKMQAMGQEIENSCPKNKCKSSCCQSKSSLLQKAFKRSYKVVSFIFIMTLLLNIVISLIGEDNLANLLLVDSILQPAVAALIGLIPNCVSSILLTELYIEGIISFGSVLAGLCTGAGVGLLVLFKSNRPQVDNFKILVGLYSIGTVIGLIVNFFIGF